MSQLRQLLSVNIQNIAENPTKSRVEKRQAIHSLLGINRARKEPNSAKAVAQAYHRLEALFQAFEEESERLRKGGRRHSISALHALRKSIEEVGRDNERLADKFSKAQRDAIAHKLAFVLTTCETYQISS